MLLIFFQQMDHSMNNNTIIGWGLSAFLIVCLLIVQVMILTRWNSYEESMNSLNENFKQLETENADLRQQLEMPPAVPSELPDLNIVLESISEVRVLTFLNIFLVVILTLAGFVAAYFLIRQLNEEKRERRSEARHIQKQAYQNGLTEAFKGLVTKTDVLSNLVIWLAQYENGWATIDDAAKLQKQFFEYLASVHNLEPIGEVGKVTTFTPTEQKTHDRVSTGDKVIIVEPGWRLAGQSIEQPVVSKDKSQS